LYQIFMTIHQSIKFNWTHVKFVLFSQKSPPKRSPNGSASSTFGASFFASGFFSSFFSAGLVWATGSAGPLAWLPPPPTNKSPMFLPYNALANKVGQ